MFVHTPFVTPSKPTVQSTRTPQMTFAGTRKTEFSQNHHGDTVMFGSLPTEPVNMQLLQGDQDQVGNNAEG